MLQSGTAALNKIFGLLAVESELKEPRAASPLAQPVRGELKFDGVSFAYAPETVVLHSVGVSIEPGQRVALVGPTGAGQLVKIVNQILVVVNQLAASEALLFAQQAGLDLGATIDAVKDGAGGSWMLANRGPQMIERDWRPGFSIDLQQKDLRLALDAADELGVPLPGTALVFQLYRALQNQGLGAEGNHALVKALEEMANITLGG